MKHDTPTNRDQIIDSRDVIARIEELESLRDSAQEEAEEHNKRYTELVAARNSAEADDTGGGNLPFSIGRESGIVRF